MQLKDIVEKLELVQATSLTIPDVEVETGYVSDLLSNVMGQAAEKYIWITMQGHPNVAAIASLLSLACVVVAGGASIDPETLERANENEILMFQTNKSSFDTTGKLYALGVKGHE